MLLGLPEARLETSIFTMAKSTVLLSGLVAISGSALAASNFPDCGSSGPLGNNPVCDTSLGEPFGFREKGQCYAQTDILFQML